MDTYLANVLRGHNNAFTISSTTIKLLNGTVVTNNTVVAITSISCMNSAFQTSIDMIVLLLLWPMILIKMLNELLVELFTFMASPLFVGGRIFLFPI